MTAPKLYVVGFVPLTNDDTRITNLVVTGIGERVLVRDLSTNCKPHAFKHREAASIILARARVQHPECGDSWHIVGTSELRALQGLPPTRKKRAPDVKYTHADHIHAADEKADSTTKRHLTVLVRDRGDETIQTST